LNFCLLAPQLPELGLPEENTSDLKFSLFPSPEKLLQTIILFEKILTYADYLNWE